MSDFGADVFDQDRPKGTKHRAPQDDRSASLPAPDTKAAPVHAASPVTSQPARAVAPGFVETQRRERTPAPEVHARPREARPAREQALREAEEHGRFEPPESRWRDDPPRIASQPPREPAEHHRPMTPRRAGPPDHSPPVHSQPAPSQPAPSQPAPSQHRERHTEFRSHHEGSERPHRERTAAREPVRLIERNTQPPAPAPQRVGLLVDLEGLQAEARAQQGELAMHRLRSGLGSGRTVAKALAIAKNAGAAPSGFDLIVSSGGFAAGVQFAAAAVDLLRVAPVLVMAPTSDPIRKLASALRAAGHTVELAGFGATEASARRLGRDCLFVP